MKRSNIAGAPNDCTLDVIYEDDDYNTKNHAFAFTSQAQDNMYDLSMHCGNVEEAAIDLCKKSRKGAFSKKKPKKKPKKKRNNAVSHVPDDLSPGSIEMENLLEAVKEMAGLWAISFL